ncbi:WD repeat-containing protein 55-like [Styela clava]|uniref:WD repeat-containing protein 55-like n=1 Tax=Styela clava TaxID=7725 RepID=UPI001939A7A0|nr:WD repeat-containing protein 55-like [Styela clava]
MSDSSDESGEEEEEEVIPSRPKWVRGLTDFTDFAFHPTTCNITTADMDGYLGIYKYEPGKDCENLLRKRLSKKPLRSLTYSKDASGIFVSSKAGSLRLFDIEVEKCSQVLMKEESPSYCISVINHNLVASGDDDGTLKVWDIRKGSDPIIEEDRCHDFISCIAVDKHGKFLFATSGDGTMSTFNIKRRKFIVQSENTEYDMSCVGVIKDNKKVIVGTSEGLLLFFNWNEFAAPSDRFPGHPTAVECLTTIDENVICTGSMDGMIRAVHLLPNRFLGVVGEHHDMPVNKITVSYDKKFIASSANDSTIKFWTVDHLQNTSVDGTAKPQKSLKSKKLVKSGVSGDKFSFMSDLDKDMTVPTVESSESEDESDSEVDTEDDT